MVKQILCGLHIGFAVRRVSRTILGKNPDDDLRDEFLILEEQICSITKEETRG